MNLSTQQLLRQTVALVLAAGRGTRLGPLTAHQAKASLPFGGKFRLIDFALSNCLNSGIRRIGVLTQYKSQSLVRHLHRGWSFLRPELNESIELLPAQQRVEGENWYRGTADAVYQNLDIMDPKIAPYEYVLILPGDHVLKMDLSILLRDHVRMGGRCTIACTEVGLDSGKRLGVLQVDGRQRVEAFVEKPSSPSPMPDRQRSALASMGIYVFDRAFLQELLDDDQAASTSSGDFGRDIIPRAVRTGAVYAHHFRTSQVVTGQPTDSTPPYWRTAATIDAYWAANLDLAAVVPPLDIYDTNWPIWTHQLQLPPAKFVLDVEGKSGTFVNSILSGGCIVTGSNIKDSVLFSGVRIHSFSRLLEAVVLHDVEVGEGCRLTRVIVESGSAVPAGLVVGEDPELDARRFERSPAGVVLLTKESLARIRNG